MTIGIEDFERVEMRVGRVLRAEPLEGARKPAYRLWIDLGPEHGVKKSSAQVTANYGPADLEGRLVLAVTNFPPRQVASFMSEVLVLGVPAADGSVVLIGPDRDVPLGGRVY